MRTWLSLVFVVATGAIFSAASSLAASSADLTSHATSARWAHSFVATVRVITLVSQGAPLVAGSRNTNVGVVNSSFGNGAVVAREVSTGHIRGSTYGFRSISITYYLANGTMKAQLKGTFTINPDGTVTRNETEMITGGTGRYRGASGRLVIRRRTDRIAATTRVIHLRGTIDY
jgi:hypothetical protein